MENEALLTEKWKDIPNYEGLYKISNTGKVLSLSNYGGKKFIRKTIIDKYGYERVVLVKNQKQKNCLVHRLVAQAFIPNPNNYPQVNHKDENKANNSLENLEWCTRKYNCNYGTRLQKLSEKLKVIRKGKHFSRNTEFKKGDNSKMVIDITTNKKYNSMREAYEDTGIPTGNICLCCFGKIKQTKGHIWRYFYQ